MPAIFELIVTHRNPRCVGLVGVIQTLFSTIWAASKWDTKCITDRNYEWRSHTDCSNTGQLRCHNCSSGMTAMKILTRIEFSPVEGPQSIFWPLIGSLLLLLAECTYITKRSSSTLIFRVTVRCTHVLVVLYVIWYWYFDIYLLQLGFHPVAMVC